MEHHARTKVPFDFRKVILFSPRPMSPRFQNQAQSDT
jgi:hypothetical protein